jgi:hypothetical protein
LFRSLPREQQRKILSAGVGELAGEMNISNTGGVIEMFLDDMFPIQAAEPSAAVRDM